MNPLQEWLDGPQDYEAGRLLYAQHGPNFVLKRTLSHGPTAYNRSALREELARLAKAGPLPVASHPAPAAPAVVETVLAAPPAPATAQLLEQLDKQWKPPYKEASHLQGQLRHAKDVQQRCEWAHRILDLMDSVQDTWDAAAYAKQHGQLPPEPAPVAPPPALDLRDRQAVLKRRNGLRSQVSKQRRNADRAAEVAAWREEIAQLDNVLQTLPAHAQPEQE